MWTIPRHDFTRTAETEYREVRLGIEAGRIAAESIGFEPFETRCLIEPGQRK